ncbi:hypothetical protein GBAR_LOCUS4300, partial [Geodia barretti]
SPQDGGHSRCVLWCLLFLLLLLLSTEPLPCCVGTISSSGGVHESRHSNHSLSRTTPHHHHSPYISHPYRIEGASGGDVTVEEGVALEDPQFLGLPSLPHHHLVPLLDCDATLSFLNASNIHKLGVASSPCRPTPLVSVRQLQHGHPVPATMAACSVRSQRPSACRQTRPSPGLRIMAPLPVNGSADTEL